MAVATEKKLNARRVKSEFAHALRGVGGVVPLNTESSCQFRFVHQVPRSFD